MSDPATNNPTFREVDPSVSASSVIPAPAAQVTPQPAEREVAPVPVGHAGAVQLRGEGVITTSGSGTVNIGGDNFGRVTVNQILANQRDDVTRQKADFINSFLTQALRQATITFYLSIIFMTIGGIIMLSAGAVALGSAAPGSTAQALALASGSGGSSLAVRVPRLRHEPIRRAGISPSRLLASMRTSCPSVVSSRRLNWSGASGMTRSAIRLGSP
jgi:hypothetical protein